MQVYGHSRRKITGLSSKTALFEDGWLKIQGSSSKTALFEDGLTNKPQLILNNRPKRGRKHEKTFRGRWLKGKLGKFQRLEIKSFLR